MRDYTRLAWMALVSIAVWDGGSAVARTTTGAAKVSIDGQEASPWVAETGTASYYGKAHQGRRTASGTRFDEKELTAAHPWLPFGTKVLVTLQATGQSVIVTITDRLYSQHRIVDLSVAAARQLGMLRQGIAMVSLTPA